MARISVITGTRRSGREERIDGLVSEAWGAAILIVPTAAYARRRLDNLLARPGIAGAWNRPVMTFQDFVDRLAAEAGLAADPLDEAEQRLLLEEALAPLAENDAVLRAVGPAAATAGFADHMMRVIHELKQQAVEPGRFRDAAARRSAEGAPGDLDAAIAEAYDAYQNALIAARRYDRDGLYWVAAAHVAAHGLPGAFNAVRVAAFDGFDDFTESQFRLIRAVAERVERVALGLACDFSDTSAADLYEIPSATLRRIQSAFDATELETLDEAPPSHAAAFAAHRLFGRSPGAVPGGLPRNLHVVPRASAHQEIEWIAREVKALLRDGGAAPQDIAVVYRDSAPAIAMARRTFAAAGIPLRTAHRRAVSETAAGRFVLGLLQAIETWDRDAICDVMATPWFGPGDGSSVYAVARFAQIVAGRDEWIARLLRLQRDAADESRRPRGLDRIAKYEEAIAHTLDGARRIERLDKALGTESPASGFIARLRGWLGDGGFGDAAADDEEARAAAAIHGALGRFAAWSGGSENQAVSRTVFARRLRAVFDRTYVAAPSVREGVLLASAEETRHLRFRYVFFAGLNEGMVPGRPAVNAVFTQEDIAFFRSAGVRLEERQYRASYEMLLFHRTLDLAGEALWLSYRMASADGKELLRSSYLTDVEAAAPGAVTHHPRPVASDIAPGYGAAASYRDGRNRLMLDGAAPPEWVAVPGLDRARAGAAVERSRWSADPCGAFDGVLPAGEAADAVAARYGPERVFSVSSLERYAQCPFQFFMTTVLGVEEPEIPEEEFDPRVRGTIAHRILERFHRHYAPRSMGDLAEIAGEARETMAAIAEEEFAGLEWRSVNAPEGLKRVEGLRIQRMTDRYLTVEFARIEKDKKNLLAAWTPAHFETSFGLDRHKSKDPWTTDAVFTLDTPAGPVRFGGKIDRIDLADGETRIVDYKTGAAPALKEIVAGRNFQLNLYALALEALIAPEMRCASALFIPVGSDKIREALAGKGADAAALAAALPGHIGAHVAGLRGGRFHPAPHKKCHACTRHRACRYEGARMAVKFPGQGEEDEADEAD